MRKLVSVLATLAGLVLAGTSVTSNRTVATQTGAGTAPRSPRPLTATAGRQTTAEAKSPDLKSLSASQPPPSSANRQSLAKVFRVQVTDGERGETFVDVSTTNPTAYHTFRLENPPRLVVNIENARAENLKRVYHAQSALLKDARIGQYRDTVVRVVIDLADDPTPDVYPEPGGLRIALKPAGSGDLSSGSGVRSSGKLAAPAQSPPPKAAVARHPNSDSQTLSHRPTSRLEAGGTTPAAPASPPQLEPLVNLLRTVPVALTGSPDAPWLRATALPEPPRPPRVTLQAERAARTIALDAQVPPTNSEGKALAGTPAQAQPKYTGEAISVNLKDVDLTDFFRLIHEVSGLNIVVDPSVTGKVTLVLDSVPWDQALDIVLKNNGLGRVLQGNVVRIARLSTLAEEEGSAAKLEQARLEVGPLVTVFRPLKYARAVATGFAQGSGGGGAGSSGAGSGPSGTTGVIDILKNLAGVLSKRGEVVADPRDNALIITDVPSQIPVIQSVVDKLDTKPKQISIEARIVQANSDFVRDLESAVNGGTINRSGTTVTGGATGTGASAQGNIPTSSAPGQPPPPRITLVQTAAAGFGAYAISNQAARYFINAALAAAETRARAKVISEPTIITQNNVLGKVSQGVQVPVQTNINNTVTTQFKDATLELDVTPQVTGDGNIFLVLYVQNNTPGAVFPGLGTSINTQSATTQVLVPDGGTVVFGGIKVTRRAKSATQVPGLGSVPILGYLFKSSQVNDNDQELLFFVTPKMLPG